MQRSLRRSGRRTTAGRTRTRVTSERGIALLMVLLLLMLTSALATTLTVGAQTEVTIVGNYSSSSQARASAEAGISHAGQTIIDWLSNWKPNGYATVDDAFNALLADSSILTGADVCHPADAPCTVTRVDGSDDAAYELYLTDEDDPDRGVVVRGSDVEEDDAAGTDANRTVVIQSVGYGPRSSVTTVEAIVTTYKLPAIATNGDLTISGVAAIHAGSGSHGGVHANGNLTLSAVAAVAGIPDLTKGTASASGTCSNCTLPTVTTNPGESGGGRPSLDIPEIRAQRFRSWADRVLTSSGRITDANGNLIAVCSGGGNPCQVAYGLRFSGGTWDFRTTAANDRTYYVEAPVTISAGTVVSPLRATIIATGAISATGSGYITPAAPELLVVTDKDLTVGGNFRLGVSEGQILVREQIAFSGNSVLAGQVVIENATSTQVPHTSSISGGVVLTNNSDVGSSFYRIAGWRQLR